MIQLKNKPDTRFRACLGGCEKTVWTEVPITCSECRRRLAVIKARLKAKPRLATAEPLPAAVARGVAVRMTG